MGTRLLLLALLSLLLGLAAVKSGIFDSAGHFSPPVSSDHAAQALAEVPNESTPLEAAEAAYAVWADRSFPREDPAEATMLALLTALASGLGSAPPDWALLLQERRISQPRLCEAVVRVLRAQPHFGIAEAIRPLDDWRTPAGLRAEVLHTLWSLDPMEGFNRCRRFFLREKVRAQDQSRVQVVERVLTPALDPRATELLITVATSPQVQEFARRLAIRALVARQAQDSAPYLDALFRSEDTNSALRREAFSGAATLNPDLARRTLIQLNQNPNLEFNLEEFLDEWRRTLQVPFPKGRRP